MAPHCDTMDGPVVSACKKALEKGNVYYVLPFVSKKAEDELIQGFNKTLKARRLGQDAAEVADLWFFETAVRLHREGEGAPYTGLKPAGLDWGPVVPKAEKDIEKGDPTETIEFLKSIVEEEVKKKFDKAMRLKDYDLSDVDAAREYTESMLHFVLSSHHLYKYVISGGEHL
ncbi:MAG: hypothetical protein KKF16_03865 [Euryarchaeota archaeon]|nr:hypothetical protein [Euryarchaeota archaeon]MBV1730196.1 hypothetical protein [Methanobacterium sp.]MBU4548334.1 hypothetical protein [Euryarchaeota archaeon]MBU4607810.1 hypothetical protein [Euryarchaeota archaeon]MBV1754245.1 hypothetical protein [Methanobacterium sp.]